MRSIHKKMAIFGSSGGTGYLGVDIGSSSLKIVELKSEKGRPKLITYGYAEQDSGILKSDTKESKEKIVKAIQLVRENARTSSNKVVAALPSYTVFSSIIALPEMPKRELEAAVQWEAKKFVPMPIEEMILDWKILEGLEEFGRIGNPSHDNPHINDNQPADAKVTTQPKKQLKILITAAPKKLVSKYVEIFKMAQLELASLETESFALERSLVGNDKSPILLIDIGATATNIVVVVSSVPLINRSIDLGGKTITKSLAGSLNIDIERAEQFKRDFGLTVGQAQGAQQIPQRIEFMVNSIINEVRYVIDLYQSQTQKPLEKVVLAGGSAWLPNLSQYLAQALQLKVFIGDPWSRIIYPTELKPVLQEIGPALAVSVGLAMREIV